LGAASNCFSAFSVYPSSDFLGTNFLRQTNAANALAAIGGGSGGGATNFSYTAITNAPWTTTNSVQGIVMGMGVVTNGSFDFISGSVDQFGKIGFFDRANSYTNYITADDSVFNFLTIGGSARLESGNFSISGIYGGNGSGLTNLTIPSSVTNQFLTSIPVAATNQFSLATFTPRFFYATNDFTVTNIVITNHIGYSIVAPITNNGMYEIEVNAIARGNQSTDRPYIITWITNAVNMGYVFTSRAFNGNGYAGWSSGFEQGAPTPGFILATNTSGLDTFLGNRPISENRPVSGTAQSSTANHIIVLRLTNAPINLFMSCSATATGTNTLKAGSYVKVTRIE
jgi:hypothetical protein